MTATDQSKAQPPSTEAEIIVLGSGQDGGIPQMGREAQIGPARRAASIVLRTRDGGALLFDASPDLRLQQRSLMDFTWYRDRPSEEVFDAVFLTHGHMGHYAGLVHFGREANNATGVELFGTARMQRFLAGNAPWSALLGGGHLIARIVVPDTSQIAFTEDTSVAAIAIPHRAEFTDTVAYSISVGRSRVLYLPDIDSWQAWPTATEVLAAHDLALVDGTFFDDTEPPGRPHAEVPHPPMVDTAERFGSLADRIVFTHLNRSNPAGEPRSPQAAVLRDAGFRIAHDGLRIGL